MKKKFPYILPASIIAAAAFLATSGVLWLIPVYILAFALMREMVFRYDDGRAVLRILLAAAAVRVLMVLAHGFVCNLTGRPDVIADASTFTSCGIYVRDVIKGQASSYYPIVRVLWYGFAGLLPDAHQLSGLAYMQGVMYSAFGYSLIAMKLINSLVSVATGFLVYRFLKDRLPGRTAIIAMTVTLFWPTTLIWSVTGLKEAMIIFFSMAALMLFAGIFSAGLNVRRILVYLLIAGTVITFVDTLRVRMWILFFVTFVLSWALMVFSGLRPLIKRAIVISAAAALLLISRAEWFKNEAYLAACRSVASQVMQARDYASTNYRIYPERMYVNNVDMIKSKVLTEPLSPVEWASAIIKGLAYFGFSPFFYQLNMSKALIGAYPVALLTLSLLPFAIKGSAAALGRDIRSFLPFLVFMLVYWAASSLISGNIGSAFRHRDIMMPIYIMFSVIGFPGISGGRK